MGADWLKDGFNVALVKNLPEIKRIVTGICRHYGCLQHVDDVCSEVLLHIQLQYLNHPTYFESKQHLLATPGRMQGFACGTSSGKCVAWSSVTPGNCQNL